MKKFILFLIVILFLFILIYLNLFNEGKKMSISNNSNLSIEITDKAMIDNMIFLFENLEEKKFENEKEKTQFIEDKFMNTMYRINIHYQVPWREHEILIKNEFIMDKNRVYYGENIRNILSMIVYLFNKNLIIDLKLANEQYIEYKDLDSKNDLSNIQIETLQNIINNSSVNQDEFAPLILNNIKFPYIVYYGICNYGKYEVTIVDEYNFSLYINDKFISMYKLNDGEIFDFGNQIVPESKIKWRYFIDSSIKLVDTSLYPVKHKVDMTFFINKIARIIDSKILDNLDIAHTENFYVKFSISKNNREVFLEIFDDYYVLDNKIYNLNNVGSYFNMLLITN